jgi:hypothetical protein
LFSGGFDDARAEASAIKAEAHRCELETEAETKRRAGGRPPRSERNEIVASAKGDLDVAMRLLKDAGYDDRRETVRRHLNRAKKK